MAWDSKEEEAMYVVCLHMRVMKEEKKREANSTHTDLSTARKRLEQRQVDDFLGRHSCNNVG